MPVIENHNQLGCWSSYFFGIRDKGTIIPELFEAPEIIPVSGINIGIVKIVIIRNFLLYDKIDVVFP